MVITTIKTRIVRPPRDNIFDVIFHAIKKIPEKSILVVTSKIVSIGEGQCIPISKYPDKDILVAKEADWYLTRKATPGAWCMHTLKNNIFIPSAGIDVSNANGYYILWPKHPKHSAKKLWIALRKKYRVKKIGVIISDSHTIPLRRGVLGISLAHYGFEPLKDYRFTPDLFGRPFEMTFTNIADGITTTAVMLMGEGKESTPLALVTDIPWVKFTNKPYKSKKSDSSFEIKTKEDLYYPLLSAVKWKKGNGGRS